MNEWRAGGIEMWIQVAQIIARNRPYLRYRNPRPSPRRWLLFLLVLTACTLPRGTPPVTATVPVVALQLEAPTQIKAGVPLTVLVHVTPTTATTPVLLTAHGTFGFLPQQQRPVNGVARFPFMLVHTRFAGTVHLSAIADGIESSTELLIVPGPADDPMLPLVGPRAIVTGGEQWTMAVVTPRDALDNPVAEGTAVTFRIQHPTRPMDAPATGVETQVKLTQKLLAWARIYSRQHAGPIQIAANADFGHSPERVVLAVPGAPQPFQLLADKLTLPADGRQLVRISSSQLTDRFGNVLLDGANVTLVATVAGQEERFLPAVTIDGRIYTTLQAPSQPGTMTIQGWLAGIASAPLTITFTPGPAVQPIRVVSQKSAEGMVVIAGPLLGELGQFIPDGAAVTFTITAPDGQRSEVIASTDYGYAQILLRRGALVDGDYRVQVAAGTGQGSITFNVVVAAWSR